MIKKYRGFIIFFYIAAVLALIAAAFCDLKLDIALNNPENSFAIWFRKTGEIPSRLICPLAGCALFYTAKKKIFKIISLVLELGGSAYLGYYLGKYFFIDDENRLVFSIIYGLGTGVVILIAASFIKIHDEKYIKIIKTVAAFAVVIMFLQIGIVEAMKYLWGRVRFRDLLEQGSYDNFTPWYQINGINGNKSFPSGHTAGAGMSYLMMFLPFLSEKWRKKSALCFCLPCVYTSIVAYTRLVMGAHYLSDVAMGGIVSFSLVIIGVSLLDKKVKTLN